MDKNRFSRFEERIQALVEGGFARLFAGRLHPRDVAVRLARAMENSARSEEDGSQTAPNHFIVRLHPDDHDALLRAEPGLPAILADHLVSLARESGFRLDMTPEVQLVADESLPAHSASVEASHAESVRQSTQAMKPVDLGIPSGATHPPSAFLVVDGTRYVPLDRSVINIGRRRDNTIVLDDARVSRQHCQLRFRFGQFVVYDLGSRGGTMVNNAQVSECVLRPGDVISLAGVQLVYVVEEGTTGRMPGGDTEVRMKRADLDEDDNNVEY